MHLPAGRERRKESLPASVSFILRCALPVSRIGLPSADRNTWPPSRMVCEKQAFQNRACMSPVGTLRPQASAPAWWGALRPGKPAALRPRFVNVTARRGDVKAVEVAAAEAAAVRRVGRQRVGLDHGTARREHVDERAGPAALPTGTGDDVALGVEAHAFDPAVGSANVTAERVQNGTWAEDAVVSIVHDAQLAPVAGAGLAVGHIERLLVA